MKQVFFLISFILLFNINVFAQENDKINDIPNDFSILEEKDFDGKIIEEEQYTNLKEDRELGEVETFSSFVGSFIDGNLFLDSQKQYWEQYTNNYIYNQLSLKEKNLWNNLDDLYYQVLLTDKDFNDEYAIANLDFDNFNELWNLANLYRYSHPQFYFLTHRMGAWRTYNEDGSSKYGLCIFFYDEFKNGKDRQKATNMVKDQLNNWIPLIKQEGSEYLRVKTIHDLIIDKVNYDYKVISDDYDWAKDSHYSQSMYSVLTSDLTVCAGYALTYSCLANYAKINNTPVTSSGHAWNYTTVGDDTWYNIDLTWDDNGIEYPSYKYFLVSNDFLHNNDNSHVMCNYWEAYLTKALKNYIGYETYNGITYYGMPIKGYDYSIFYELGNAKLEDFSKIDKLPLGYNKSSKKKLPDINRIGYNFIKWTDANGESISTLKNKKKNLELKANWKPITYNISYIKGTKGYAKDVKGTMKISKNLKYDEGYTLSPCQYKKAGYKFIGWTDNKNGTEVKYLEEQRISNLKDSGGTVKLYALWEKE